MDTLCVATQALPIILRLAVKIQLSQLHKYVLSTNGPEQYR